MKKITNKVRTIVAMVVLTVTVLTANAQNVGNQFTENGLKYEVTSVSPNKVKVINPNGSSGGGYSGDITIPASVTNNSLEYSVTEIGEEAFYNCTSLTSITIPSSVTEIGSYAFENCTGLTSVTIGNSVEIIKANAFSYCQKLTTVEIPSSVTEIGNAAFSSCTGLTSITIPSSVTEIGSAAFSFCQKLTTVEIPSSVTEIGSAAFGECTGLTSIISKIENIGGVTMGSDVFDGVNKSIPLTVPKGKKADYQGASQWNAFTNIVEEVTVGDTFTEDGLKYEVTSVSPNKVKVTYSEGEGNQPSGDITIPATVTYNGKDFSVTEIGEEAFSETDITSITIPNSVIEIGNAALDMCTNLTAVNVDAENTAYSSENGVLFNKDKTTLMVYPAKKTGTNYDIPNSVDTIGSSAFAFSGLTEIIIPNSVTTISSVAFGGCENLTTITIPNSVTKIGESAFAYCEGLTSIISKIESIGGVTMGSDVFEGVNKTTCTLKVPKGKKADYQGADQWSEFTNVVENTSTGISTVLSNPISIVGNNITVSKVANKNVKLYSLSGQVLYNLHSTQENVTLSVKQAGTYILQVENATRKVVVN